MIDKRCQVINICIIERLLRYNFKFLSGGRDSYKEKKKKKEKEEGTKWVRFFDLLCYKSMNNVK
tara:strand:+ start:98 stop:289 length:192 start_codon:yes stop_codon:yes gene_type:complete